MLARTWSLRAGGRDAPAPFGVDHEGLLGRWGASELPERFRYRSSRGQRADAPVARTWRCWASTT